MMDNSKIIRKVTCHKVEVVSCGETTRIAFSYTAFNDIALRFFITTPASLCLRQK
jgi:hypothetical protein